MHSPFTTLEGIAIEIRRRPVKHIYLRIYPPDGRICLTAPQRLSQELISEFIKKKQSWILAKQIEMRHYSAQSVPAMTDGSLRPYLGQNYPLEIHETTHQPKVLLKDNVLQLWVKPHSSQAVKERLLENWYRHNMKALLPILIDKWQAIIGVHVAEWGIKAMKTRWGSCNTRARRIWLNLELIKKPELCLESVLVHEMVHLLEPSHNKRFYALMDKFMPQWREHQQSLKK